MAYDVLDNVYSIFMDVKTGVGGSSGSNTFYNTDVNTSFIEIILTERDKNLTMTDYTYIVSVDKADGTSYVNRYTASEANKMSIKLDTQLLACEGECTAQLYVLKDDKVRTMMEFNYFVKNGVFDGAKPPSHNEDSIYISLMKEFTDLKENVLIAIGKMDGIESSIESVKNIADTNTNTINSEKKKTEANTSTIEGHTRSISEINNTLQTHSDKIQASEETITQHTEKLQGHDSKLEEYNTTIQEHGRTLESQGASITEQGEKISKNETDITQNKKDIKANTAEINKAKTATTGEKFSSVSERIDAEVNRINNKIEVSFVPQEEAESHTILNTVEGMSTDMVVKGRTLQNFKSNVKNYISKWVDNGDNYSLNLPSGSGQPSILYGLTQTLKENQKYTVIVNLIEYTSGVLHFSFMNSDGTKLASTTELVAESKGLKKFVFTINNTIKAETLRILPRNGVDNIYSISKNILILEGDWTNKPIPEYFEGIKSFGQEEGKISILSSGKNLWSSEYSSKEYWVQKTYLRKEIQLKPNTQYAFSIGKIKIPNNIYYRLGISVNKTDDVSGTYIVSHNNSSGSDAIEINKSITFTTPKDGKIYLLVWNNGVTFDNWIFDNIEKIQLEEASKATHYEQLQLDKKDILLQDLGFDRGVKAISPTVYDELNSIKNKAIKKIGGGIFTGDEDWQLQSINNQGIANFSLRLDNIKAGIGISNKFKQQNTTIENTIDEGFFIGGGFGIYIRLRDSRVNNIESLKQLLRKWSEDNTPLEFYYELAEPVETPLDENIALKTFGEKTYVSFENSISGTSSFKAPVDTLQTIARLTTENKSLLSSNVELDAKVTEAMKKNQQLKEEAIATQSALDYILMNTLKA